jgi:hypothetical protein
LKDILYLICRNRPEVLRSKESVRLDVILKHRDMSELIDAVAELTVQRLSYKSLAELALYFRDKLGLALAPDPLRLSQLTLLVEIRNLIVHNRGIANSVFLTKTAKARRQLGKSLGVRWKRDDKVAFPSLDDGLMFLARSALSIDMAAVAKFGLAVKPAFIIQRLRGSASPERREPA